MNCPICKTVVAKLPEQLHGRHCKCPKDEHVGLLLELFETLEHRADKLNAARRMLDLRESQLADCTRVMREVSIEMDGLRKAIDNRVVEAKFYTARTKRGVNSGGTL